MVAIMLKTWHRMKQVIFSLALSMCSPREKKMCEWLDSNVSLIPRQVQERATGLSRSSETLVQRIFSTLRGQLQYKRNSVNTKETWTPGPFSGHLRALHCPASLLCPISLCWSLLALLPRGDTLSPSGLNGDPQRHSISRVCVTWGKDSFADLMKLIQDEEPLQCSSGS